MKLAALSICIAALGCGSARLPASTATESGALVHFELTNETKEDADSVTIRIDDQDLWRGSIAAGKSETIDLRLGAGLSHELVVVVIDSGKHSATATIAPGTARVPIRIRLRSSGRPFPDILLPSKRPPTTCAAVGKGAPTPQRIRLADRMSQTFELSHVVLRIDGVPLFPAADEAKIVGAMRAEQSPEWTTPLPAGCHVLTVDLTFVGRHDWVTGYKFEIHASRAFETGVPIDVDAYEIDRKHIEERPAIRFSTDR